MRNRRYNTSKSMKITKLPFIGIASLILGGAGMYSMWTDMEWYAKNVNTFIMCIFVTINISLICTGCILLFNSKDA